MAFPNGDIRIPVREEKPSKFRKLDILAVVFWAENTTATKPS